MLLKRIAEFVLQSRMRAILLSFLLSFMPVFGSFSIVIAAFVTLRKGVYEGTLVVIATIVPIVLGYAMYPNQYTHTGLSVLGIALMIIVSNVMTWIFAVVLRKYANWSWVLQVAAVICLMSIALIHFAVPNIQTWWGNHLTASYTSSLHSYTSMMNSMGVSQDDLDIQDLNIPALIAGVKAYATGLLILFLVLNALLQLYLARWWQAAVFNPGGLRKELYEIRMSYVLAAIFIIGLVGNMWNNNYLTDMMPTLYILFFITGLSVIHCLIHVTHKSWLWLLALYVAMIFYPLMIICVAMLGLIDTFVDFRKKFSKV